MYFNPIHPHCGPFNSVSKKKPKDAVDAACWKHDKAYGRIGKSAYWNYNYADEDFINDMDKQKGFAPYVYKTAFKVKRFLSGKSMGGKRSRPSMPWLRSGRRRITPPPVASSQSTLTPASLPRRRRLVSTGSGSSDSIVSFLQNNMPQRNGRVGRRRRRLPRRNVRGAAGRRRRVQRRVRSVRRRKATGGKTFRRYVRKAAKKGVSYTKRGAIYRYEDGAVVSDPQCVYLGHSVAWALLYQSLCRAIIRELFRIKGEHIVDFRDYWLGGVTELRISYKYGVPNATTLSQGTYDFPATTTYEGLAQGLYASFVGSFALGSNYVLYDVWMNEQIDPKQTVALLNMNQCKVHFSVQSTLKIQNATLGSVDGDDEYTDIHNRPVVGRFYQGKRQLTGFIPSSRYLRGTVEAGYTSYLGSPTTGLIYAANASTLIQQTKKPPPGYFFNAKASGIKINPGQIRKFRWNWNKSFGVTTFLQKFPDYVAVDLSTKEPVTIGPAQMVGLEKEIDTRAVTENNISLGYQIQQTYSCALTFTIPKVVPFVTVTT